MFSNNRKTIGVFISEVYNDYQNNLCRAISDRAIKYNYNVAFFTNFGGYGQKKYDIGEFNIAKLPNYEDLDGIILAIDTIAVEGLKEYILNKIRSKCHCPVVSVRRKIDDFYNVLMDDNTVLEDIITHFIDFHHFKRINFLAGPKDHPDSIKRLETYKRILSQHQIPIEEERIYYGDFWSLKAKNAVDYWLSSPLERPEAIVCANDYMALALCDALLNKGISVPGDISVSGFDDIADAAEYSPTITTEKMPVYEMGLEAVDKVYYVNEGIKQEKDTYFKSKIIYRESCGCKISGNQESNNRRVNQVDAYNELSEAITGNAYMSTELTGITKLEDIKERLGYYVYMNSGFSDFFMCLRKNWDEYKEEENSNILSRDLEMTMEVGIQNRKGYESKIIFDKNALLPKEFAQDKPVIYYFVMLHHLENCFGYVAINFMERLPYNRMFQAWLINVSNALENIRIHSEMNRLVYKLEDMYIRDDLTGLYNRRGLANLGQNYLVRCAKEQVRLMVLTADVDKFKHINDNYGHAIGDVALKVVANALQHAADDDEICVRTGGDEFMVLGMDYNEKKMDRFAHRFVDTLNKFNQDGNYEFKVYVSYGWSLIQPGENTTIEECLAFADSKMYQQKYEKESKNLKVNLV